jgi:RNA polymerase sigma-70 factor (ECF subfamily)
MNEDSRELVDAASEGDVAAVEELIALHLPRLRAFIRLRAGAPLRARESASDLIQSTCREILENVDRFQYGGEANFRYWLFTTAQRKIADRLEYYKAAKRNVEREVPLEARSKQDALLADCYSQIASPSEQAVANELRDRMEAAFGKLNAEQREVILLAKVVGLSRSEIAEKMGRSVGAIRMLLSRSLSLLASSLDRGTPR